MPRGETGQPRVPVPTVSRLLFVACSLSPGAAPPLYSQLPSHPYDEVPSPLSQSTRGSLVQAAGPPWSSSPDLTASFGSADFGMTDGFSELGGTASRVESTLAPVWTDAELVAAGRPAPQPGEHDPREQFLVFESWGAGFNNERMSLEIAYVLALVYCRTLVLPPLVGDRTRLAKQFRYEAFFDISRMRRGIEHATRGRATLLTADEFLARIDASPEAFGLTQQKLDQSNQKGRRSAERGDTLSSPNPVKLRPRNMERGRSPGPQSSYFVGLERPSGFSTRIFDDFDLHATVIVAEPLPALERNMRPATVQENLAQARWPSVNQFATKLRKKRLRVSAQVLEANVVLNIGSERLLGNYYSVIYIPQRRIAVAAHATLRKFLTLRSSLYDAAEQAAAAVQQVLLSRKAFVSSEFKSVARGRNSPGGGIDQWSQQLPWAAIHNRQGDFELLYPQHWFNSSEPKQVTALIMQHANIWRKCSGGGVYYATTYSGLPNKQAERAQQLAVENKLLPALHRVVKPDSTSYTSGEDAGANAVGVGEAIVMWKDIEARVVPPVLGEGADMHGTEWKGIVEMLICAKAPAGFVGSFASTFTGYIHRMRGGGATRSWLFPNLSDDHVGSSAASKMNSIDDTSRPVEDEFQFTRHDQAVAGLATAVPSKSEAAVSWAGVTSPSAIVWSREWSEGLGLYATER